MKKKERKQNYIYYQFFKDNSDLQAAKSNYQAFAFTALDLPGVLELKLLSLFPSWNTVFILIPGQNTPFIFLPHWVSSSHSSSLDFKRWSIPALIYTLFIQCHD